MANDDDQLISIRLTSDRLEASLIITPGIDRSYVTTDVVLAKALSQALQPSPKLSKQIEEALKAFADHNFESLGEFKHVIATGQPSEDGQDGSFTLEPELQQIYDYSKKRLSNENAPPNDAAKGEALDHYNRTMLMVVKSGQRIGQVNVATDGTDGIDVCGNTIRAKPGKQNPNKFDAQTIECHDSGAVLSKIAGQLIIEHDSYHISPTLTVDSYVDYSTGNIDFPGNVEVRKGVRDCFQIVSGKSITVGGLVEAAELVATRDIELLGGIAGRDKGTIHAGRDLIARYLNGSVCRVGRDLIVDKEICDCQVAVTGNLCSPTATIIGGHIASLGSCQIAQIGSEAGTHTVISLGRADTLDGFIGQSLSIIKKLSEKASKTKAQMKELRDSPDASSLKAEMMTSLQFEASEAEAKMVPLKDALRATLKLIDSNCEPVLQVQNLLCLNTEIRAGGFKAVMKETIKGPLTVRLDDVGELILQDQSSGSVLPLKNFAKMSPDETSYNRSDMPSELRKSA